MLFTYTKSNLNKIDVDVCFGFFTWKMPSFEFIPLLFSCFAFVSGKFEN